MATYNLELLLEADTQPNGLKVTLTDRELAGENCRGSTQISRDERMAQDQPETPDDLLTAFLEGGAGSADDGLLLGRYLFRKLIGESGLIDLWNAAAQRRGKRPLRLELVMDAHLPEIAQWPFELLADNNGFFFRCAGFIIVRVPKGLPSHNANVQPTDSALVAWAQPPVAPAVQVTVFESHVAALKTTRLNVRPALPQVSRQTLADQLTIEPRVALISLVAHGGNNGGSVLLHGASENTVDNVPGTDLAQTLKQGKVAVALLWICHAAQQHPVFGDLATILLHPDHGDLATVIASHAAVRAKDSATISAAIFKVLERGGNLETAVSESRHSMSGMDLHWAAFVHFARPNGSPEFPVTATTPNPTTPTLPQAAATESWNVATRPLPAIPRPRRAAYVVQDLATHAHSLRSTLSVFASDRSLDYLHIAGAFRGLLCKGLTDLRYNYLGNRGAERWLALAESNEYKASAANSISLLWSELQQHLGNDSRRISLIGLGAGEGTADRNLLELLSPRATHLAYFPIDISMALLQLNVRKVRNSEALAHVAMLPILADLAYLANVCGIWAESDATEVYSLLGCTIGNFRHESEVITAIVSAMGHRDVLLLDARLATGNISGQAASALTQRFAHQANMKFATGPVIELLGPPSVLIDPTVTVERQQETDIPQNAFAVKTKLALDDGLRRRLGTMSESLTLSWSNVYRYSVFTKWLGTMGLNIVFSSPAPPQGGVRTVAFLLTKRLVSNSAT